MPEVIVEIFDTTMRDGAQALPSDNQFENGLKPKIGDEIAKLGAGIIEAGFPATKGDAEEVSNVARTVGNTEYAVNSWFSTSLESPIKKLRPPVIAGLSRTVMSDIEATWEAIEPANRPRIHTFVSTDTEHMAAKFPGKSPDEVLEMGRTAIAFARDISQHNPNSTVEFSAEAASTTHMSYLEKVVKTAIDTGADVVNLPDTVGQRSPFWMHKFYSKVIEWVMETNPSVIVSSHNHNDLGLAVANSFSLVQAAADYAQNHNANVRTQIESTICGLGERAGNADIFPIMAQLFKFTPEMPVAVKWEFNPALAVSSAVAVLRHGNMSVQRQNPVVGSDINRHRSGIHSDGIIKGGYQIYTPHDPTFWGHTSSAIHEEGKYQGANGRRHVSELNP